LYLNCTESPPEMKYQPTTDQNCPALAWTVTNKYLQQADRAINPHQFILNPHFAKNIPVISLSKIKRISDPNQFKDKVLLVGFIPNPGSQKSLPSVVMQSIATEQIIRNNRPHQSLPTPIFILLWSGISSIAILQRKWQLLLPAGMILLSLGTGFVLFANGIIAPFPLIVITVTTASVLIGSIRLSSNLSNL
jgi:CHASE2 domain-containing sensor protein